MVVFCKNRKCISNKEDICMANRVFVDEEGSCISKAVIDEETPLDEIKNIPE